MRDASHLKLRGGCSQMHCTGLGSVGKLCANSISAVSGTRQVPANVMGKLCAKGVGRSSQLCAQRGMEDLLPVMPKMMLPSIGQFLIRRDHDI
mmetsp:Transcript_96152/g.222911  ORF Transcript_96152/g.222911 Transcript_96152/m.222911 type:complete len:93 (+) Transcript_96152:134-412(+)